MIYLVKDLKQFTYDFCTKSFPAKTAAIGISDQYFAWVGKDQYLTNLDQLKRYNIPYFISNGCGGTTIVSPNSVSIMYCDNTKQKVEDMGHFLLDFLSKKLNMLHIPAFFNENTHNDLLIKTNKIAGLTWGKGIDNYYCAFSVSVYVNNKMINKICAKRQEKTPTCLSGYGITTEQVYSWLIEAFNNQGIKDILEY